MDTTAALVLIIEDSIELAESLADLFAIHGKQTIIARSGQEGIALALERHPDVILLDIRLPDITGYDVFNTLRQDDWGKTARIVVLTASESVETIAHNIALPLEHILFKPTTSLTKVLAHVEARLTE